MQITLRFVTKPRLVICCGLLCSWIQCSTGIPSHHFFELRYGWTRYFYSNLHCTFRILTNSTGGLDYFLCAGHNISRLTVVYQDRHFCRKTLDRWLLGDRWLGIFPFGSLMIVLPHRHICANDRCNSYLSNSSERTPECHAWPDNPLIEGKSAYVNWHSVHFSRLLHVECLHMDNEGLPICSVL
jgi:hypothetical protein